ncbi:proton-conducting transporter transmembrane domain-containing protein, partial [Leptospira interrogans]|uniref:proton-conducting transporter transmembrane domain-containing protein n=1 Tax=Leptospira interrogans TaxID=173 RepID=UPI00223EDC3F
AIKVPLFPLHTWMPDVHSQAPTVGSVDLSGILLKIGLYGFVRLAIPLFPEEMLEYRELLGGLCIAGIIYGAVIAMAQENSKRVVAFSSLSIAAVSVMVWGHNRNVSGQSAFAGAVFSFITMLVGVPTA